jgi:TatA/E family protein of Tat protein translocase
MDIFGMGPGELLVIMILALVLFGPGKLPEIAATVGRAVREFRNATRELTSEFEQAFREVQVSTTEVATSVLSVQQETHAALQETRAALNEATDTVSRAASTVALDQVTAPATMPVAPMVPPLGPSESTAVTASASNGRREPTKDDPLADLVDVDELLTESKPSISAGPWET